MCFNPRIGMAFVQKKLVLDQRFYQIIARVVTNNANINSNEANNRLIANDLRTNYLKRPKVRSKGHDSAERLNLCPCKRE